MRSPRKPSEGEVEVTEELPKLSYTQFKVGKEKIMNDFNKYFPQTKAGDIQPIYKFYKKYPFGYSSGGR